MVSVVIPFYSGLDWLKEAINSVLNQTYQNIEILVINDGSRENINELLDLYGSSAKIISKVNGGPASARNLGIEKSTGKYIAFLDSDDLWLPDKLSKQIRIMELSHLIWSQHSYEMFWDDNDQTKLINTKSYSGNVYRDCFISLKIQTSCVVVLRKFLMDNNIRFPLEKRYGQDGAFFRQVAKKYPLGYIDGVYSRFRMRGANAGFRAKVQLNDKASIFSEIKTDKDVLNLLPNTIVFAYKVSNIFNKWINYIDQKYVSNDKIIEIIAKIVYFFPYAIFRCYAKKS